MTADELKSVEHLFVIGNLPESCANSSAVYLRLIVTLDKEGDNSNLHCIFLAF